MSAIRPISRKRNRERRRLISASSVTVNSRRTRLLCEPLEARRLLDGHGIMAQGDFNGDFQVDVADLNLVIFNWNETPDAVSSQWTEHRSAEPIGVAQLNDVLFRWHDGMDSLPHGPGGVHGTKWEDLNGNGQRDDGEPGLAGVTIYSDRNHNSHFDSNEPHTVTMEDDPNTLDNDETGDYWLDVRRGRHLIREVVPDGSTQTFPLGFHTTDAIDLIEVRLPPMGAHFVIVHPGETIEGIDFGNRSIVEPKLGSVHGTKWLDANGDSQRDTTEPGLAGVTIYSDLNHNGEFDSEEPHTVTMDNDTATPHDETGMYWLDVRPGPHVIREVVPHGFRQTFPFGFFSIDFTDASLDLPMIPGAHLVFVAPGQSIEGKDFGNRPIDDPVPASVHGVKWADLNGNGVRDPDEPGLPGVTIFSDLNNNAMPDPGEPRTVTMEDIPGNNLDEAGRYWLEGLRPGPSFIFEVVPDGFLQTFPTSDALPAIFPPPPVPHVLFLEPGQAVDGVDFGNRPLPPQTASVHGVKWADLNGNGQRDSDEPGLPGVTIYLDVNLNGEFDGDEPHAVTIDNIAGTPDQMKGHYWIEDVDPGFYLVREVVPDGFEQTFPEVLLCKATFCTGRAHIINLEPGDRLERINFGNRPIDPETGSAHGTKWEDLNGNGQREDDEPGLPGVTIYSDLNGNGVPDPGEPRTVSMEDLNDDLIDDNGKYWLAGLHPGPHTIREVVPDGFIQTFPLGPIPLDPNDPTGGLPFPFPSPGAHHVIVEPGQAVEGLDFGNQEFLLGFVHGLKWLDRNGNGQRDADEPGLGGVVIYSDLDHSGTLDPGEPRTETMGDIAGTIEDETGHYWLEELHPGFHAIREVVPSGFEQTFPDPFTPLPLDPTAPDILPPPLPGAHFVFLENGGRIEGLDFGNRPIEPPTGSIHGTKWLDRNGNAERDPNEPGLPSVTVYVDLNNNGVLDADEPRAVTMENDPTSTVDEAGRYWLENLPAGEHLIREVVPDGFRQTFPLPDGGIDPGTGGGLGDPDEFATVHPEAIHVSLAAGELFETIVSITLHPFFIVPVELEVIAPDASVPVANLTGVVLNGGGGDTSSFEIHIFGDGGAHHFNLQFVNLNGNLTGIIPVSIRPSGSGGAHRVLLEPGDVVVGIDFGNQPIVDPELASIHGVKWEDLNGNGERENNEPGLPGVTIYSDLNGNGVFDSDEPHTVTMGGDTTTNPDQIGMYWLEDLPVGEHLIREVVPDGFRQTFPHPDGGIDPGTGFGEGFPNEFSTVNPESIHVTLDAGESFETTVSITLHPFFIVPVEMGVTALDADVPVLNLSGIQVNGGRGDTSTFEILIFGDGEPHQFDLAFVDLFGNINGVIPVSIRPPGSGGGAHRVLLEPGDVVVGIDFGNRRIVDPVPGSIHGVKWEDINGNGERDANEPGLPGVTIYLDTNVNDAFDPDEPHAVTMGPNSGSASQLGHYWIENVDPGTYFVREVLPEGFEQSFPRPLLCLGPHCNGDGHIVTVEPGGRVEGIDFGNVPLPLPPGSVHGVKWEDVDGDGQRGPNEPGIAGVVIYSDLNFNRVLDDNEPRAETMGDIASTADDETGRYWLRELHPGDHIIREVIPDGFVQTWPAADASTGIPPFDVLHFVIVVSGQATEGVDFGNQRIQPGSVHGLKWGDINADGQRGSNEPGLPGVIIYSDLNRNGAHDDGEPQTVTMGLDPNGTVADFGRYWLEGLEPGFHLIREVVSDGFVQTFPPQFDVFGPAGDPIFVPESGAHRVFISNGRTVDGLNFGNHRIGGTVPGTTSSLSTGSLLRTPRAALSSPALTPVAIPLEAVDLPSKRTMDFMRSSPEKSAMAQPSEPLTDLVFHRMSSDRLAPWQPAINGRLGRDLVQHQPDESLADATMAEIDSWFED